MRDLGGRTPGPFVDAGRLCAASFSAGRLVGYMEALEAADEKLARAVEGELAQAIESVADVRRKFESTP